MSNIFDPLITNAEIKTVLGGSPTDAVAEAFALFVYSVFVNFGLSTTLNGTSTCVEECSYRTIGSTGYITLSNPIVGLTSVEDKRMLTATPTYIVNAGKFQWNAYNNYLEIASWRDYDRFLPSTFYKEYQGDYFPNTVCRVTYLTGIPTAYATQFKADVLTAMKFINAYVNTNVPKRKMNSGNLVSESVDNARWQFDTNIIDMNNLIESYPVLASLMEVYKGKNKQVF